MNQSLRAIIDNALDDEQYDTTAYNTAEHYDTVFDTDIEKLASALEFLGGNLNNIGTPQEKLLDLYEFSKLAEGAVPPTNTPGGAPAGGAPAGGAPAGGAPAGGAPAGGAPAAGATGEVVEGAAGNTPKKGYKVTSRTPRGSSVGFMQGLENTWKSGAGGKAALIGGAGALIGTGALLNSALSKNGSYNMYDYDDDYDMDKLAGPRWNNFKAWLRKPVPQVFGKSKAKAPVEEAPGFLRRTWDSGPGGKAAIIGTGLAVGGAGAYGVRRLMKKKSSFDPAGRFMYDYDDYDMDKLAGPKWDKVKTFFKRKPKAPTEVREQVKDVAEETAKEAPGFLRRTWDSGPGGKAAIIGTGLAVGGAGAYGVNRLMNKNSSFDPTAYFSDHELYVMDKTASMHGIPTEAYAFAKMAMYEGYVTNIEDGLDMAKEAGIFDFWYGKEYNDAMTAARAEAAAARGSASSFATPIELGKQRADEVRAARDAIKIDPFDPNYSDAERARKVRLGRELDLREQDLARQTAAEQRLVAAQQAEEGVRAGRRNIFRRGADAIKQRLADRRAAREATAPSPAPSPTPTPTPTPTETRKVVKEVAEGGGASAAKPGFFKAHGGKLALGAGALALGGGAYALSRRRNNRR